MNKRITLRLKRLSEKGDRKGFIWCLRCYRVEWPGVTYATRYGGYHYVSLGDILEADEVVFDGGSKVHIEYFEGSIFTKVFIEKVLEVALIEVTKEPALLIGQIKTEQGLEALEKKLKIGGSYGLNRI